MDLGGSPPDPTPPPSPPDYEAADRAAADKNDADRRRRLQVGRGSTLLTDEEGVKGSQTGTRLLLGD